jgi:hypothetical protein
MEQITNTIAKLQAEVQRQREEITFLCTKLQNPTTKPKLSLPNPKKFNGQAHKYDT